MVVTVPMVMESPEALALELEESSMLPPEQPARDNAITAAALAATNLVENLVVPEFLRTLVFARPRGDDQFADYTFSPSLDMSR